MSEVPTYIATVWPMTALGPESQPDGLCRAAHQTGPVHREMGASAPRKQAVDNPHPTLSRRWRRVGGRSAVAGAHRLPRARAGNSRRRGRQVCIGERRIPVPERGRVERRRLAAVSSSHELAPDLDGQSPARDPLGRRVVVVAEPNAGHELAREADEPGVTEILAGASLAGDRPTG